MNLNVAYLKAICDRSNWSMYGPLLLGLRDQEKEIRNILFTVKTYYDTYPNAKSISVDELKLFFQHQNPSVKDNDVYDLLFHQITIADLPNNELLREVLDGVCEEVGVREASMEIIPYLNGDIKHDIMDKLQEIIDAYRDRVSRISGEEEDPQVCTLSVEELIEATSAEGLKWQLGLLNRVIGPLPPGYLGHIFACSNVGKSSLAISQAAFFAHQLRETDTKILYLNNEEAIRRIQMRFKTALLDKPWEQIIADPQTSEAEYLQKGGRNIVPIGGVTTLGDVERRLRQFSPRVAIVDQGPKLSVMGEHARHESLMLIYNGLRELAKDYNCSIISLGQADGPSENKMYLGRSNVEGSKAGYLQGECDFMIGIGMTDGEGMEDIRYLSIPKNKLFTGREGTGAVSINRLTGRYSALA